MQFRNLHRLKNNCNKNLEASIYSRVDHNNKLKLYTVLLWALKLRSSSTSFSFPLSQRHGCINNLFSERVSIKTTASNFNFCSLSRSSRRMIPRWGGYAEALSSPVQTPRLPFPTFSTALVLGGETYMHVHLHYTVVGINVWIHGGFIRHGQNR